MSENTNTHEEVSKAIEETIKMIDSLKSGGEE